MSYNQKPPGASGSGMGGGPPNGPNNMPQVAKTFAGIQQQMQNLVHGQNAIPQTTHADLNSFLQQQRIQNMLKQQQQFLQFQHQMQQQQQQHQQQQQQHQHHNMSGGGGVGGGPVGGATGTGSGGSGGSGEPLALTRTPGAAELLNKTYQQQANGNPTANPAFNQLQPTFPALPQNFLQQLQAVQYQFQAKQMQQQQQQQQHGGGQAQHGHGQQQPVQGVPPPPPPTTTAMSHQQQQQQQKHQNQHQQQQQQQQAALSRFLTVAAVQAAAVSGNKMSTATPPPPPPLTNQMKPPNLPPNTQITPVNAASIGNSGNLSAGIHPKMSAGNIPTTVSSKHQAPPPSISLTPSKTTASAPSAAHQQNKFTPPVNTGNKGGHLGHAGHSQNQPKSTHGANTTATSNTTSPAKTGTNTDATVAALISPQSTPVQLTKQIPPTATTAAAGAKTVASATITTPPPAVITIVSPNKSSTTSTTTASTYSAANTPTTAAASMINKNAAEASTSTTTATAINVSQAKSITTKPNIDELATNKLPLKSLNVEKEAPKPPLLNDSNKSFTDLKTAVKVDSDNKSEPEKVEKDQKSDAPIQQKTSQQPLDTKERPEQTGNDVKSTSATSITVPAAQTESKESEYKAETPVKSNNKPENHDTDERKKKLPDAKSVEKDKTSSLEVKSTAPINTAVHENENKKKSENTTDDKKPTDDLNHAKDLHEAKKADSKEEKVDKEKKVNKTSKVESECTAKDIFTHETEADKSNTAIERKPSPSTQAVAVKPLENDELNAKDTSEPNNKKESSESAQHNNTEEKKTTPPLSSGKNVVSESTTLTEDSKLTKDVKIGNSVQNKDDYVKLIKSTEKADTVTVSKPATTNNTITEKNIKEANEIVKKDCLTAAATPVKKIGRQARGTKSKAAAVVPATATDSKSTDVQGDKPAATTSARVKRKSKALEPIATESAPSTPKEDDSDRKSKRHRLKTILYQSPLPELAYITKLSASEASNSPKPMSNEDRLIVFYKNEYMAVRNAEGTFYLCQTMQNVYRTSPRISIRWLSEDAKDNNVFIPDFYDHTDIECVLTTVELKRIDKGHLRLPKGERSRIESILKKAIDVEKGLVPRPELTEENPDGLDISLFKDESQIEKKSALNEGGENQTPSNTTGRKSRRGNLLVAASARRSNASAAATPSTSSSAAGNRRKRGATAASRSSARKSQPKKRKTLTKRRKKTDNSDDDDDDETSDDNESDTEYKPTQKRSSLNTSGAPKSTPRAQRSPLAKARAASPITPTTSRSKNVPQKSTPTPSTSKASRGERAAKRKSIQTDGGGGSSEETSMPVKKPMTTSNNNKSSSNKASAKISNETTITPVKKSSSSSLINTSKTTTKTTSSDITTNSSSSSSVNDYDQSLSSTNLVSSSSTNKDSQTPAVNISENSGDVVVPAASSGRAARSRK